MFFESRKKTLRLREAEMVALGALEFLVSKLSVKASEQPGGLAEANGPKWWIVFVYKLVFNSV